LFSDLFSDITPTDVNIITPDYESKFKTEWFDKKDFKDLFVFSVPSQASFGSEVFGDF
jgi:hypothetical protein